MPTIYPSSNSSSNTSSSSSDSNTTTSTSTSSSTNTSTSSLSSIPPLPLSSIPSMVSAVKSIEKKNIGAAVADCCGSESRSVDVTAAKLAASIVISNLNNNSDLNLNLNNHIKSVPTVVINDEAVEDDDDDDEEESKSTISAINNNNNNGGGGVDCESSTSAALLLLNQQQERQRRMNNSSPFPTRTLQKKLHHMNSIKTLRKSTGEYSSTMTAATTTTSISTTSKTFTPCDISNSTSCVVENEGAREEEVRFHIEQMQRMKRRDSLNSNGELYGSLVGKYEESILTGRLSTPPSKPISFICQIGVLAMCKTRPQLKCPPQVIIPFKASFYEWTTDNDDYQTPPFEATTATTKKAAAAVEDNSNNNSANSSRRTSRSRSMTDELGTPYVGTVDLEWGLSQVNGFGYVDEIYSGVDNMPGNRSEFDPPGGYRIPLKGRIQILIKNENKTVVKMFFIPYDYRLLKPGSRTFLRQKYFSSNNSSSNSLRFALHLQFLCLPSTASSSNTTPSPSSNSTQNGTPLSTSSSKRLYLFKSIRVVFSHRVPDETEILKIVYETPEGKYDEVSGS